MLPVVALGIVWNTFRATDHANCLFAGDPWGKSERPQCLRRANLISKKPLSLNKQQHRGFDLSGWKSLCFPSSFLLCCNLYYMGALMFLCSRAFIEKAVDRADKQLHYTQTQNPSFLKNNLTTFVELVTRFSVMTTGMKVPWKWLTFSSGNRLMSNKSSLFWKTKSVYQWASKLLICRMNRNESMDYLTKPTGSICKMRLSLKKRDY